MKNALVGVVVFVVIVIGLGVMAYRLGVSNCRESFATESSKVQQMAQESDRNIREKVLSATHSDNLTFLLSEFKRAD